MKQLTEIMKDVFVVEVPKDAKDIKFDFVDWQLCYTVTQQSEPFIGLMFREATILPKGTWQYLGYCTKDEISFDVSELVAKTEALTKDGFTLWEDYIEVNLGYDSAEQSFRSLLLKHGFDNYEKLVVLKKVK